MSDTYLARRGLCANSEGPARHAWISVLVWAFAGRYIDGIFHTPFHAQGKNHFECDVCLCRLLQVFADICWLVQVQIQTVKIRIRLLI